MKHGTNMRRFPRYCLLALLLLVSLKGHGAAPEGYFLDSLDNRTGLLSVKCIGQDADGLIWFGTDKGLYNYDGYSVKSFRGLISNVQTRCVLPIGQEVLVGCNGGMWIFEISMPFSAPAAQPITMASSSTSTISRPEMPALSPAR